MMAGQSLEERMAWLEQQMDELLAQRESGKKSEHANAVYGAPATAREPAPND